MTGSPLYGQPGSEVAARDTVLAALQDGPKSSDELGVHAADLWKLAAWDLITLDPDRFPGRYVPGNPLIARLPGDDRPWPGWRHWNV